MSNFQIPMSGKGIPYQPVNNGNNYNNNNNNNGYPYDNNQQQQQWNGNNNQNFAYGQPQQQQQYGMPNQFQNGGNNNNSNFLSSFFSIFKSSTRSPPGQSSNKNTYLVIVGIVLLIFIIYFFSTLSSSSNTLHTTSGIAAINKDISSNRFTSSTNDVAGINDPNQNTIPLAVDNTPGSLSNSEEWTREREKLLNKLADLNGKVKHFKEKSVKLEDRLKSLHAPAPTDKENKN